MVTEERNWCGELRYEAAEVVRPTSVEQLQELVAAAPRAKALGTRHSFSRVADTPGGLLIDLEQLPAAVSVDLGTMTATVPARWRYAQATTELERAGVALPNLGSLPHISVGGAVATGTHGSGDTNQVLSAHAAGLKYVAHDGELRVVERDDPDLPALAVGLGAFGIVTEVVLDVEPSYQVAQDYYAQPSWARFLDELDAVMASTYSVNVHGSFGPDLLNGFWVKHRLAPGQDAVERPAEWFGASLVDVEDTGTGRHTLLGGRPGPWNQRLPHFTPEGEPSAQGDELQSEYMVARADAPAALEALRRLAPLIDPHLHGFELRTIAADDLWMSTAHGRDTFSIGFTWKQHPDEVRAALPAIEAALDPFAARPHLGKLSAMSGDVLAERQPRAVDFFDVIDRLDPTGTFASPYLDALRPTR